MITRKALPRRSFLKGVGTAIALPFLDSMVPAFATPAQSRAPLRMVFTYVPNGIDMRHWNPDYEGRLRDLPRILKPLEPFKDDLLLDAIRGALDRSRAALRLDSEMRLIRNRYESLTPREREVMALVVSGLLNKQVGGELGISEITVKAHRGKVMQKMEADSLADLVKAAERLRPAPSAKMRNSEIGRAHV